MTLVGSGFLLRVEAHLRVGDACPMFRFNPGFTFASMGPPDLQVVIHSAQEPALHVASLGWTLDELFLPRIVARSEVSPSRDLINKFPASAMCLCPGTGISSAESEFPSLLLLARRGNTALNSHSTFHSPVSFKFVYLLLIKEYSFNKFYKILIIFLLFLFI